MSYIKVKLDGVGTKLQSYEDGEQPCPFCKERGALGDGFPGDQCPACGAVVAGIYGGPVPNALTNVLMVNGEQKEEE